jgi:hypothetical protein
MLFLELLEPASAEFGAGFAGVLRELFPDLLCFFLKELSTCYTTLLFYA